MTAWRPRPCPAQVTNTPWNERVTFVFDPKGAEVKKALHVSPFMDMDGTWWVAVGGGGRQLVLGPLWAGRGQHWKRWLKGEPSPSWLE